MLFRRAQSSSVSFLLPSRQSVSARAAAASTQGTARGTTQGSCRPGTRSSVSSPVSKSTLSWAAAMEEHDAYHALQAVGGLVVTGPTGTNVNDITMVLTDR